MLLLIVVVTKYGAYFGGPPGHGGALLSAPVGVDGHGCAETIAVVPCVTRARVSHTRLVKRGRVHLAVTGLEGGARDDPALLLGVGGPVWPGDAGVLHLRGERALVLRPAVPEVQHAADLRSGPGHQLVLAVAVKVSTEALDFTLQLWPHFDHDRCFFVPEQNELPCDDHQVYPNFVNLVLLRVAAFLHKFGSIVGQFNLITPKKDFHFFRAGGACCSTLDVFCDDTEHIFFCAVRCLCEHIITFAVKDEIFLVKSDVMSIAIDHTRSVAFSFTAYPLSVSASALVAVLLYDCPWLIEGAVVLARTVLLI